MTDPELEQERERLHDLHKQGDLLRELKNHPGWKVLLIILSDKYKEQVQLLITQDSANSRAYLKALEDIAQTIDTKILLAEDAAEQLKAERFKDVLATPE